MRNARDAAWDAPCRLRIPSGTSAALGLARLQCADKWEATARYLSKAQLDEAGEPPRIRVREHELWRRKCAERERQGGRSLSLAFDGGQLDTFQSLLSQ